ncbi:MAG: IS66 family transposase, partial [bacterium]
MKKSPKRIDLTSQQKDELLERIKTGTLGEGDYELIKGVFDTLTSLGQAFEEGQNSIKRLLGLVFGARTEKTKNVLKKEEETKLEKGDDSDDSGSAKDLSKEEKSETKKKRKKTGGRIKASDYTGAQRVEVTHPELNSGDHCPCCENGKVYPSSISPLVRITGVPPIQAKVYEHEKLRCNLCGDIFTPQTPPEAGTEKYDNTAKSMIALLKYGYGFPFYRITRLQDSLGVPFPASNQWKLVKDLSELLDPVYSELIRQAAQGEVIYLDDTTMKILELLGQKIDTSKSSRKGVFTSAFLSTTGEKRIGLFFTGRKHAGENMTDLMEKRDKGAALPIQMCDALSRNMPKALKTLLANCLIHARRNFVDVTDNFPEACRFVLEILSDVYRNEHTTKEKKMTPQERLEFHQSKSAPLMEKLLTWLKQQFLDKKVEPNSGLGKAISYMIKHWKKLTLFLRVPKAPLDNNLCEQVIKQAILHRKNSLFYKTNKGAEVGDLFMSLIYTCKLSKINPFD